jgi:AbrB family looped-hinge helix DNA binding protein
MVMKMTSRGRVTIPIEVRESLGLETGDEVDVVVDTESGCAVITKSEWPRCPVAP